MRQIKFRVWSKADKEMSDLFRYNIADEILAGEHETYIPLQFTGLTDKNGKEIYEGNIVRYCYQPGEGYWNYDEIGTIEWETTGFFFNSRLQAWLVSVPGASNSELWEVMGNIYENPELLEGK